MNDSASPNGNLPGEWQANAPASDSSHPPSLSALSASGEVPAGAPSPPLQRNREALVGFILGSLGLVLCAGRLSGIPFLGAPFIAFAIPVTVIGICVSGMGCRLAFRRALAIWGLLFSFVAFVLFVVFALIIPPTRMELRGLGLLLGLILVLVEGGGFGGFAVVIIWGAVELWWEWFRMLRWGVTVEGYVADRRTQTTYSPRYGTGVSYYLTYRYLCGGETNLQVTIRPLYKRARGALQLVIRFLRRPSIGRLWLTIIFRGSKAIGWVSVPRIEALICIVRHTRSPCFFL